MSGIPRALRYLGPFVLAAALFILSLDDAWTPALQTTAWLAAGALLLAPFVLDRGEFHGRALYHRIKLAALIALLFLVFANVPYWVVNDRDPELVTDPGALWFSAAIVFLAPLFLLLLLSLTAAPTVVLVSRCVNVLLVLLLAWGAKAEYSARRVPPQPTSQRPPGEESWLIRQPDQRPRFVLRPNHTFHNTFRSNPRGYFDARNQVEHTTNADGYRGPLRSVQKPPDTYRILILGDSTAYGWGVRDEHVMSALLEKELEGKIPGKKIEGMVFAAPGYNTDDERDILRAKGLQYQPDMVIVWYAVNDVAGDWEPGAEAAAREERQNAKPWYRRVSKALDGLIGSAQLKIFMRRYKRDVVNYYLHDRPTWQAAKSALREIEEMARGIGAQLVVAIEPTLEPLGRHVYPYREVHRVVREFCRAQGIRCYDLWESVMGRNVAELWVYPPTPTDIHPNEIARQAFAKYLAEHLLADGVLP